MLNEQHLQTHLLTEDPIMSGPDAGSWRPPAPAFLRVLQTFDALLHPVLVPVFHQNVPVALFHSFTLFMNHHFLERQQKVGPDARLS